MRRTLILGCAALVTVVAAATAAGGREAHAVRNGKIAFFGGAGAEGIEVVRPDGSGRRLLVPVGVGACASPPPPRGCGIWGLAWSPDGTRLAYLRGNPNVDVSLFVIDAAGRDEKRISGCGTPWPTCGTDLLSWSPDGSRIVVSRADGLYVLSTTGRGARRLTGGSEGVEPTWSPDGKHIAFVREALYTVRPDGSGLKRVPRTAGAILPAWSPDGRTLAFARGDEVDSVRLDGSHLRVVKVVPQEADSLSWAPDGARLLYGNTPGHSGAFSGEVWTVGSGGTAARRLFRQAPLVDYSPTAIWSPDGKQVAISAAGGFYVVGRDGTHLRRIASGTIASGPIGPELAWQPVR
ncbi:MAG: hypothetical protein C5B48_09385 [Candidatus Rokuibacteriota bacterium]|nr:MAG: hypothetical protein C5B48_09385 [Candidatus Rokubacteria bacterium]